MIEDARNKKLDIIMTKSISRFGRNTLDTIQTLRELKDLDVTVIFDQEHLDTSKEDSEMILTTLAAFAEEENKNRRDNQNWAIKKRLKDGTSEIYSRACFGYTKSDIGELTIDRKQAEIVQNIFTMYLSGMSILGIVKELERQGIKSPTGKDKWCKRTIDTMLSNEKYIGNALVFKTYSIYTPKHERVQNNDHSHEQFLLNDDHLPIISKEVFDAVQEERLAVAILSQMNPVSTEKILDIVLKINNFYSLSRFTHPLLLNISPFRSISTLPTILK